MLIKPTKTDPNTPLWYTIGLDHGVEVVASPSANEQSSTLDAGSCLFFCQKSQAATNSFLRTIVNVFETKQSPYRILLGFGSGTYYQVAVADTLEELQRNHQFVLDNIVSGMKILDEEDRETWALDKLNALLASGSSTRTDESLPDVKVP